MEASIYRIRPRDLLILCVGALLATGLVMVQSASTSLNGCIVRAVAAGPTGASSVGPVAPAGLMATTSPEGIELTWRPDPSTATLGYRIYRAAAPEGPFTRIQTLRKPLTLYNDRDAVPNRATLYRVTSFDDAGRESARRR